MVADQPLEQNMIFMLWIEIESWILWKIIADKDEVHVKPM